MDSAEALRNQYEALTANELGEMLRRKEPEGLTLDFKQADVSGNPNEHDIENLKIALSGFANSAGGIILWGCTTKDGKRDMHHLCGFVPIKDGALMVKRLHELSGNGTDPAVDGVRHEAIQIDNGFVVKTLVPASESTPHRTRAKHGQYYKRNADAFLPMEHFEIADMFGRRARPKLEVYIDSGFVKAFYIAVGLRNVGRGMAKYPFLSISVGPPPFEISQYGVDGNGNFGLRRLPRKPHLLGDERFAGGANDVILPGGDLLVTGIARTSGGPMDPAVNGPELFFHVRFGAEGVETQSTNLLFDIKREARRQLGRPD